MVHISERDMEVFSYIRENGPCQLPWKLMKKTYAVYILKQAGLIREELSHGIYEVTELALGSEVSPAPKWALKCDNWKKFIPLEPSDKDARKILFLRDQAINSPKSKIFNGRPISTGDVEFIETHKATSSLVIWFLYPLHIPLKHIAWALRGHYPLITDQTISIYRYELGMKRRTADLIITNGLMEGFKALLDEGENINDIAEYYAVSKKKVAQSRFIGSSQE